MNQLDSNLPLKLIIGRERDVDINFTSHSEDRRVVRILRGNRCNNLDGLFHEFAAALQFPYYFGSNWAAFDECINDLEWIDGESYLFVITRADTLLAQSDEFKTFMSIITELIVSGVGIGPTKKKIEIILHAESSQEKILISRLSELNIKTEKNYLPQLDDIK